MQTNEPTAAPTTEEKIYVAARIGRTGTKIHPLQVLKTIENADKPWKRTKYTKLYFACSCTGTANGHAVHKASILCEGTKLVNCGNSRIAKA